MGMARLAQGLRPHLGIEGADAVVAAFEDWRLENRRDVASVADEKVIARYETIQRRLHEDVAGVEIRLTKTMADLESRLNTRMADLESRLNTRMADLEGRVTTRMANLESRLEARMTELESRVVRWVVTALIINAGLVFFAGWASKHLF